MNTTQNTTTPMRIPSAAKRFFQFTFPLVSLLADDNQLTALFEKWTNGAKGVKGHKNKFVNQPSFAQYTAHGAQASK
jgi:hypothetical protein